MTDWDIVAILVYNTFICLDSMGFNETISTNIKWNETTPQKENYDKDAEVLIEKAVTKHIEQIKTDPEFANMTTPEFEKYIDSILFSDDTKTKPSEILKSLNILAAKELSEVKKVDNTISAKLNSLLADITFGMMKRPDASLTMKSGSETRAWAVGSFINQFDSVLNDAKEWEYTICIKWFASWTWNSEKNQVLAKERAIKAQAEIKEKYSNLDDSMFILKDEHINIKPDAKADPTDYQGVDIQIVKNLKRNEAIVDAEKKEATAWLTAIDTTNMKDEELTKLQTDTLVTITEKEEDDKKVFNKATLDPTMVTNLWLVTADIDSFIINGDTTIVKTKTSKDKTSNLDTFHELHITQDTTTKTYTITTETFTVDWWVNTHTKTKKITFTPKTEEVAAVDAKPKVEAKEASWTDVEEVTATEWLTVNSDESFYNTLIEDEDKDEWSPHVFDDYHEITNPENSEWKDNKEKFTTLLNSNKLIYNQIKDLIKDDISLWSENFTITHFDHDWYSEENHILFTDDNDPTISIELHYNKDTYDTPSVIKKIVDGEATVISKDSTVEV